MNKKIKREMCMCNEEFDKEEFEKIEQDNITLKEEILLNIRPEIDTEDTNGK